MKFWVVHNKIIPFPPYRGIVLYPFVFLRSHSMVLFRHELEHCYQIKKKGVVKFYLSYLKELVTKKYRDISYEQEAYDIERKPLTAEEQEWFYNKVIKL